MSTLSTSRGALTPSSVKAQTLTNYVELYDFTSTYLPETHEQIASRYGNQSVAGLLGKRSAEMPFSSDQMIWSEDGRLHTNYNDVTRSGSVFTKANHVFRAGELVLVSDANAQVLCHISSVTASTFTVTTYKIGGFGSLGTTGLTVFKVGSEFGKGTAGMLGSLEKEVEIFRNKPVTMKDHYEVSGSDVTNIGWIQTDKGYFWYLKSQEEVRQRWEDYLELQMLLGQKADTGSTSQTAGITGTEGLFESLEKRANLVSGAPATISDWDELIKQMDAEGKLKNYFYYCDRDAGLALDDMLGGLNGGYETGVSYGSFDNKEQAIDLGFKSFNRGGYNIHKNDWKLLNDPTLLGSVALGAGKVRGILFPDGTTEVYDGQGRDADKIKVPFLHIKYKQGPTESRKYKTWLTGSVGISNPTNSNDNMEVHMLSERGLCATAVNNMFYLTGA